MKSQRLRHLWNDQAKTWNGRLVYCPPGFEQRAHLEVQVGVLPAGDLVLVDVGVAGLHGGGAVEGRVQPPGHLPVLTVVVDLLQGDAYNTHKHGMNEIA